MAAPFGAISRRPEEVAQMILETLDDALTLNERRVLHNRAGRRGSRLTRRIDVYQYVYARH